ncbi:hypothetical protein BDR07DRAFT_1494951 [Suillus spraguei]|nr:hypothetical protein BDR07DRAFT_1494951 [Suillus spraguei]
MKRLSRGTLNKGERIWSLLGPFFKSENRRIMVACSLVSVHPSVAQHLLSTIAQRTDSDGDPPSSGTASPAPQHDIDDIKVEYHPSSGIPPKCTTSRTMDAVPVPHQQFQKQILCPGSCFALVSTSKLQNSHMMLDSLMSSWTASFTSFIAAGLSSLPSRIAKMLSKFNGEKFIQFIHEPWTTNAFWEYQSKIPPDAKPLASILYADKAKLSSFGHVKGYPVVAHCANLPIAIRNREGLGGGRVVGQVKEDKQHSGKPAFVNFKNAVWHALFLKILDCLAPLLRFGSAIKCWDDIIRVFYPIGCNGIDSWFNGQISLSCLVPRDELSNTLKLIVFAVHNVSNCDMDLEAYLLLCCIRSYVEFNMYASLEVHTEDTINNGWEASSKLTGLMDKYIEDTAEMSEKSWNFHKKHLSAHLFDDIKVKGVSRNYSTKLNEKMHGPLKDAYQDCTNFKNFTEQILRYNHDSLIAEYIRKNQPDTALQETNVMNILALALKPYLLALVSCL